MTRYTVVKTVLGDQPISTQLDTQREYLNVAFKTINDLIQNMTNAMGSVRSSPYFLYST